MESISLTNQDLTMGDYAIVDFNFLLKSNHHHCCFALHFVRSTIAISRRNCHTVSVEVARCSPFERTRKRMSSGLGRIAGSDSPPSHAWCHRIAARRKVQLWARRMSSTLTSVHQKREPVSGLYSTLHGGNSRLVFCSSSCCLMPKKSFKVNTRSVSTLSQPLSAKIANENFSLFQSDDKENSPNWILRSICQKYSVGSPVSS